MFQKLTSLVKEFGANILMADSNVIKCRLCHTNVSHIKRSQITQHLETRKHISAAERANTSTTDKNNNNNNTISWYISPIQSPRINTTLMIIL